MARILKSDWPKGELYVVCLQAAPFEDAQGDTISMEEMRKAEASWRKNGAKINLDHKGGPIDGCTCLRSGIATAGERWPDSDSEALEFNSWVACLRVTDLSLRAAIDAGVYNDVSIQGQGKRR